MFFVIKEIIEINKEYIIWINIEFLKKIIIYLIVPKLVSNDAASLVQNNKPNATLKMFVVIKTVVIRRHIWNLDIV